MEWREGWKPTFKIFCPIPKNLAGKTSNLAQIFEDHCQLEACNCKMAEHLQTNNRYFIFNKCATNCYHTWGRHCTEFWCNVWRKLGNDKWCAKTCIFCPLARNFLLVCHLLPAYSFLALMASTSSTYHLGAVAFLNFRWLKICLKMVCGHFGPQIAVK